MLRVRFDPTFLKFKSHLTIQVKNKNFNNEVKVIWNLLFFQLNRDF
jgi:hypothetical protein